MHGGDIYNNKVNIDFSVNVNPFGTPQVILEALQNAMKHVSHYPDLKAAALIQAISELESVEVSRIIVSNGASEMLLAAVRALAPAKAAMWTPCFSGYAHALKSLARVDIIKHGLDETQGFLPQKEDVDALLESGADLLLLGNPNNPSGRLIPEKLLKRLLDGAAERKIHVILDESFLSLTKADYQLDFQQYTRLIRVRSFTKSMAIPGVRLGYALCADAGIKAGIEAQLPEWNTSVFADAAGIAACTWAAQLRCQAEKMESLREELCSALIERGFIVYPSDTNFILIKDRTKSGRNLYEALLNQGILIRDCSDFEGLGKGYYRLAVKQKAEQEALLSAIDGDSKITTGMVHLEHVLPADIEKNSFRILTEELEQRGVFLSGDRASVIKRAIHTTADFEYAETLVFAEDAVKIAKELILAGADIVTDTNMALSGINKKELAKYGGSVHCFMADPEVAEEAKKRGITRAAVSMEKAAALSKKLIFAVGNAPTALIKLDEMSRDGSFRPDFIIGVPVGFVNVEAAKELIIAGDVPYIVNRGRKGGSNVAAAIVNALLYQLRDER